MDWVEVLPLGVVLFFGFLSSLLVIMVWSSRRNMAWWFLMSGILIEFSGELYATLEQYGILSWNWILVGDVSVIKEGFALLPWLFFTIGLVYQLRYIKRHWD